MDFKGRREKIAQTMEQNSVLILYSGILLHVSADEYMLPFDAARNFYYLTGLRRENMILMITKIGEKVTEKLFIEEADPSQERWTGKMVTVDEAKDVSGIDAVFFTDDFNMHLSSLMNRNDIKAAYFDTYRQDINDIPDYNLVKAGEFAAKYPGTPVRNIWAEITKLRMCKDADEIELVKKAIDATRQGLENVLKTLKPGMMEYQVQANYEYMIKYVGTEGPSFPTIAGSGKNGTMLHYETNRDVCEDGTLVLLDLGSKVDGYCSDITRTYPVNGKYSERQRQVYDIVLKANRTIVEQAKPGMTLRQLNEICTKVLAEGCVAIGLIKDESEIGKYYMHGVSHHLGLDVHDVDLADMELKPGMLITDEPGLYIDEWEIGIRIEDDILFTEDGVICLSQDIIRNADDIEAFMAQ